MDALPVWSEREVEEYVGEGKGERCVVVINGKLVDVSGYLLEHVRPFFLLPFRVLTDRVVSAWRCCNSPQILVFAR